jgi:hypothetical protein
MAAVLIGPTTKTTTTTTVLVWPLKMGLTGRITTSQQNTNKQCATSQNNEVGFSQAEA